MEIPVCSKALLRSEAMEDPRHTSSEPPPAPIPHSDGEEGDMSPEVSDGLDTGADTQLEVVSGPKNE